MSRDIGKFMSERHAKNFAWIQEQGIFIANARLEKQIRTSRYLGNIVRREVLETHTKEKEPT